MLDSYEIKKFKKIKRKEKETGFTNCRFIHFSWRGYQRFNTSCECQSVQLGLLNNIRSKWGFLRPNRLFNIGVDVGIWEYFEMLEIMRHNTKLKSE